MVKTFKYRIYPTAKQRLTIDHTIDLCRYLYNCGLEQRIRVYRQQKHTLNYYDQANELQEIKASYPEFSQVHSQILQDVLKRLERSYQNFFRRVKQGEKAGFPRFQSHHRYHSFTYPQPKENMIPINNKLYLPKIGKVRINLHRELPGKIKTVTITKINGKYYACFSVELEPVKSASTNKQVGIDVGVSSFVATSDGVLVKTPKAYHRTEKKLKTQQREVSRREKGSVRRRKSVQRLARTHEKVANQRKDVAHKTARYLVDNYDLIAHEDLKIQNMVKNHNLAKSIHDSGWGLFFNILAYKAEEAGRKVVKVNPHNTSQQCSNCSKLVKKGLSVRTHKCICGLTLDRDINAAINILKKAQGLGGAIVDSHALAV